MGIDQPRGGKSPGLGDDPRPGPAVPLDSIGRANGDEHAAACGEGLRPGVIAVAGPDPAHLEDQVGGAVFVEPQRPARQCFLRFPVRDRGDAVDEQIRDPGA